jgi:hypothetical protein
MDAQNHSINAVRLQYATKRKTVNVKFQVKKMNRSIDKNEMGVGNEIFQFKTILGTLIRMNMELRRKMILLQ